ncbi:MAG TPA: glycosyltransferase 87 family protein [Gemmatimonadaceae bacterium]
MRWNARIRSLWPVIRVALALSFGALALVLVLGTIGWPAGDVRDADHFQFWAGSRALLEGASPYDLDWWTEFHIAEGSRAIHVHPQPPDRPAWTTPYPLWTFVVFLPFALLPYAYAAAAWLVLQLFAVAGALVALARALYREPWRDGVLLLGLVAASQPLWMLPGSGNVTGFLFAALAFGSVALLSGRDLLAGLLFGLLAIKPHPFLLVAVTLPFLARSPLRLLAGGAATLGALVAVSLALRPGWIPEWSRQAATLQSSSGSNATLVTVDRIIDLPLAAPVAVASVLLFFGAWWLVTRPRPEVVLAGSVAVSLLVAPHGWTYDHLHLALVAAVILGRLVDVPRIRPAGVLALAVVVGPLPWLLYLPAAARNGEEFSALVPAAAFALLVVVDRWSRRGS